MAGTGQVPVPIVLQDLKIEEQCQDEWCWAAVAAGIANFYAHAPVATQCIVANARFSRSDCCSNKSFPCDLPVELDSVPASFTHIQSPPQGVVDQTAVRIEMENQRPICVGIRFPGDNDEHFVAIKGIDSDSQLLVGDPDVPAEKWCPFDTFKSSYRGSGTWSSSFLTK